MPYSEPTLNNLLTIQVYDYDRATKDEIVGSTSFAKRDILSKKVTSSNFSPIFSLVPRLLLDQRVRSSTPG
jgi:Ca2+-dependent lipid-binding protein